MSEPAIVFVEDDRFFSYHYLQRLRGHFERTHQIVYQSNIDDALKFIHAPHCEIALIILDIMMPGPVDVPPEETEDGHMTGIWLMRRLRDDLLKRGLKIMVLTNRQSGDVEERVNEIAFPQDQVEVRRKIYTCAKDLPIFADAFMKRPIGGL